MPTLEQELVLRRVIMQLDALSDRDLRESGITFTTGRSERHWLCAQTQDPPLCDDLGQRRLVT